MHLKMFTGILEQTGDGKMVVSDLVAEKEIVDADVLGI
jgi:hypothetical protein